MAEGDAVEVGHDVAACPQAGRALVSFTVEGKEGDAEEEGEEWSAEEDRSSWLSWLLSVPLCDTLDIAIIRLEQCERRSVLQRSTS